MTTGAMTEWAECDDEREIAFDGGSQGQFCNLPFLMDGQYFENCTLLTVANYTVNATFVNETKYEEDRYWCPSEHSVDPTTYLWTGYNSTEESYGFCQDHLFPPENGCRDHYEPIGDMCVRMSAYPETYDDAIERCSKEGADLVYIPSQVSKL